MSMKPMRPARNPSSAISLAALKTQPAEPPVSMTARAIPSAG
jgi:hypothetical protein